VLVLVGQIQNHESLSRHVKHMNPNEVVKHPACSWSLDTLPFLDEWLCGTKLHVSRAHPHIVAHCSRPAQGRVHFMTTRHQVYESCVA
jgi:hypothetical protein